MFCYSGTDSYIRVYLVRKDKRVVWKTYLEEYPWCGEDFEGLRRVYKNLFSDWDDPKYWEEAECFIDSNY